MKYYTIYFLQPSDYEDFLQREAELPFVPHAGLMIDVDGESRMVEQVFWLGNENRQEVYLEADSANTQQQLLDRGWELETRVNHV